ncbi:hypothetical protein [Paraburkholderia azotifigens]|uniref:Glycine zipper family protein n=1 Tax=Paraburkholderia azotifigens TaxID=2057004 RepID=A0A5C6V336_9BURK|nr:hypothetical protein [Paraburkholderia azotifigens]TXC79657.1 hypothetical protein FRZ40_35460 [Paraburkholderia azotifigens]
MTNKMKVRVAATVAAATGMMFLATQVSAQESATDDLNSCVRKEQILTTAKGAGIGAVTGFAAMLVSNKKNDALKGAAVGAAVGGIAGFATAYYTAIDTCYKKNPSWVPESNIQHTKSFEKVKKELKYKPSQGVVVRASKVAIDGPVKAGGLAVVNSTFALMTPDGSEHPVTVDRKLYVIGDDGAEAPVLFAGHSTTEQHTFEAGEVTDTVRIPIPPDAKPGNLYRVEFSVAADDKPASVTSEKFKVSE